MTKKELMQLYYLNREIMHDTEELVNMKIETRGATGRAWAKAKEEEIKKRERLIIKKIRSCTKLRDEIESFINAIDDSFIRQIFHYRYVKSMTWSQVAYMIGGYNTAECVRKMAERYLKKMEVMDEKKEH